MSETEEEARLILALTDLPTAKRQDLTALVRSACKASAREGFEKAREMAAKKTDAHMRDIADAVTLEPQGSYPRDLLDGCARDARDLSAAIRAMRDEAGEVCAGCVKCSTNEQQACPDDEAPGRSVEHIQAALLRALKERPGHPVRRAVESIAGDLGVPLEEP